MVYTGVLLQGGCKEEIQPGASFPTGLTLEPSEEPPGSIITWTVSYKHLSTDPHRAAQFTNDSSKVNGQHSVWKATL